MSTIAGIKGVVRFAIKGQEARPAWERKMLANALNNGQGAPNDLRFQCRIAQDARENFADISVPGGTLSVHQKSKPQFGRTRNGEAYLTVVLVDSRDGQSYKVRWTGDAVPRKMQEVAVKHDEGKRVAATRVALRWEDAEIVPSDHADHRARHDLNESGEIRVRANGRTGGPKPSRCFDRLCATDLA
ncbi:hypothetical protein [Nocardioides sp. URHA0032]|uniref:hypothetical protein n=1 Tax=Nocardioides sp. URHA0032 TaxID=1380388 RepID=UPI00048E6083|nr:hypothetical protein [Nocardioides sp. URHA0032]